MDFGSFLRSVGLIPRDLAPGKWHRCATESKPRSRNGSYRLIDDTFGLAQDWAIHTEPCIWRADGSDSVRLDRRDLARRRAQELRIGAQARDEAQDYYRTCGKLSGSHPYLTAKGLSVFGCEDFRLGPDGSLIVPMRGPDSFLSIQKIAADGSKRFWPGAGTKGARYIIDRHSAAVTVLCEGVATGLTLAAALPSARVVIGFNAGNLPAVAASLRYPGMIVVAADNDHETQARIGKNPGLEQAAIAAGSIGCGVAYPECAGSDWNDYRAETLAEMRAKDEGAYRCRRTENDRERVVNAQIASMLMREAVYRPPL
jgi:putative DNA primase/helicase